MRIDAVDYFDAAKERLNEANLLYENERYLLAKRFALYFQ